jgi:hypothetical protein
MICTSAIHISTNPHHYGVYSMIEDDGEQFILWQVYLTKRESLDSCYPEPKIDRTTAYDRAYFDPRISYRSTCPMYLDWTGCFNHLPIVRFDRPELPDNFIQSYPIDKIKVRVVAAPAAFYVKDLKKKTMSFSMRKIRRYDYGRAARLQMYKMRKLNAGRIREPW